MFLKNLVINLAETCHVTFACISLQVSKYKLNYLVCKNVFQFLRSPPGSRAVNGIKCSSNVFVTHNIKYI